MSFWLDESWGEKPQYTGPCGPEWPPMWLHLEGEKIVVASERDDFDWTSAELAAASAIGRLLLEDVLPSQNGNAIAHRIRRCEQRLAA